MRTRNKVDAVWLLAKEMSIKHPEKLESVYSTTDPYDIVSILLVPNPDQQPPLVYDSDYKNAVGCNWVGGANGAPGGIPINNYGFNSSYFFDPSNWFTWCKEEPDDSSSHVKRLYNIPDKCIDNIRFNNDALAERIPAQGPWDEAMTWMGIYLGYDTLQESQSSNGNGFTQVEILELRNYPEAVKDRDYSEFLQRSKGDWGCEGNWGVEWRKDTEFIKNFINKTYQYYSLRDPLDINNDSKATKCIPGKTYDYNTSGYNITCKNNLSDMFTELSVFGAPGTDFCPPNGAGGNGKTMTDSSVMPFS